MRKVTQLLGITEQIWENPYSMCLVHYDFFVQIAGFYVLRTKNVRFPLQGRTFLGRRTYVLGPKNVECSYLREAFQVYGQAISLGCVWVCIYFRIYFRLILSL